MSKRKRSAVYTQLAEYASKKEAAPPSLGPPAGTPVRPRPRQTLGYAPIYAAAGTIYEVQALVNSVTKFGGAAELHLTTISGSSTPTSPPRGFHPSQIHMSLRQATGVRVSAKVTGRPYIRYQQGEPYATGNPQQNFSAPIASSDQTALGLLTAYNAVLSSVGAANPGARIWLTEEKAPEHFEEPEA